MGRGRADRDELGRMSGVSTAGEGAAGQVPAGLKAGAWVGRWLQYMCLERSSSVAGTAAKVQDRSSSSTVVAAAALAYVVRRL